MKVVNVSFAPQAVPEQAEYSAASVLTLKKARDDFKGLSALTRSSTTSALTVEHMTRTDYGNQIAEDSVWGTSLTS